MGASTRNAGFSCIGSPSEMLHDSEVMGVDKMLEMAEMRFRGLQKIQDSFDSKVFDYEPCGGFELFNQSQPELANVRSKLDWLNEVLANITGTNSTFNWCNEEMVSQGLTGFDSMVNNSLDGSIHSGKLLSALHQKARAQGAIIRFDSEYEAYEELHDLIHLRTKAGLQLKCEKLLFCTNAYTSQLIPSLDITPARGQVIVTKPIKGLKLNGTFHYDEGFYYFRHIQNRVLLGGARNAAFEVEKTTDLNTTPLIQNTLEDFLAKHILKDIPFEIEYRWSGVMAFTKSKLPEIISISPRANALVACNGMGVALLPIMAENAIDQII